MELNEEDNKDNDGTGRMMELEKNEEKEQF